VRLSILDTGHTFGTKALFAFIRAVTRQQIQDALAVSFAFNTITRLVDAFGFSMPGSDAFEAWAKYLLSRGYR
jgi:hypothetical protein